MAKENSKAVKKGVEDEDDEKGTTSASVKRKTKLPNSDSPPKLQGRVKNEGNKVKKGEADEDLEESTSKTASNKTDNKLQKKQKKNNKKEEPLEKIKKKKRQKKVFDLPGQKRDPPDERDPLRIFYETLYKQVPASEMAATWMMESGLLPKETAKNIFERKQKTEQQQKPMKTVATVEEKAEPVTIEKKSASSPAYKHKKKTPDAKVESKQWKKHKIKGASFDDDDDAHDDFVADTKKSKKQSVS